MANLLLVKLFFTSGILEDDFDYINPYNTDRDD